jgi:hypothetical protein
MAGMVSACSNEIYNINLQTVIADKTTRHPLPNVDCSATCFYQNNIDQSLSTNRQVQSNAAGEVELYFDKGYLVQLKTSSPGYLNFETQIAARHKLPDTLFIAREPEQTDLSLSLLADFNMSEHTPYIKTKYKKDTTHNKNRYTVENWGYDFLRNRCTNNLDSADIWLERKSFNNTDFSLHTNEKGGLLPIHKHALSQSFFLEMEHAPYRKFDQSYKIEGTEAGFFVRCRDGQRMVKVIPEEYICQVNYEEDGYQVSESGIRLNYILQNDSLNADSFPLVIIYELLNKAQATTLNAPEQNPKTGFITERE